MSRSFLRSVSGLLAALVIVFAGASTTTANAAVFAYDGPNIARIVVQQVGAAECGATVPGEAWEESVSRSVDGRGASANPIALRNATNRLATGADDAVFWSGIGKGGDATAASWAGKNGGQTLEMTLAERGVPLPTTSAGWDAASAEFAVGASGNVRVLQSEVRLGSTWARVEFDALKANPNVTSITSIDPTTGAEVVLWTR